MIDHMPAQGTFLTPSLIGIYSSKPSDIITNELEAMKIGLNSSLNFLAISHKGCACASTNSIAKLYDDGLVAIVGRPRWKSKQYQSIAFDSDHAAALSAVYKQHGINCLEFIEGAYSFVILDPQHDKAYAVTDKLGLYPIYFSEKENGVIFASSANSILSHSNISRNLREDGIYDYVYFHMVPSPDSIYKHIRKIPAGHLVAYCGGSLRLDNYWVPNFNEVNYEDLPTLSIQLKEKLKTSVAYATDDYKNTGCFLSGGLDSSTVTGFFSELSELKTRAYSIGFSAKGYDEMAFARITAKHFGVELHEYYVTPEDVVTALPIIATSYDEPFGNSSALPAYFCAKLAHEDGIKRLLAGDGGDELFAGNERYAKQAIFEAYGHIPQNIRKLFLEPTINFLPKSVGLFKKAQSYINQANTPLPARLQTYNFLHQHSPAEIFSSDFISAINTATPLELQNETYHRPVDASVLNRMLYLDWQYTLADNDIRKVSHMCSLAGVEVAYPMLDEELLNFSLEIPSNLKLKGNHLRHFYKAALSGWLPQDTIDKKKQGFGLPFGVWMQTHEPLQNMAYDSLLELKNTKYFNNNFIDQAIHLHRTGHAAYYGELIWILMVLQLWMAKHA